METFYLIIVIILFALAISDLIVGVSNDAVNFLNSAVGSRAGSFKLILIVSGLGILVGSTFSSGMMEVARKGIFHPEHFYFSEIILLFLAVMVTDIILLDTFNTFGLPTSTTVSIVFELLGAAVAFSIIKVSMQENALDVADYINTSKAITIISGIFLSVIVAFTAGAIIQYFTRMIFSFDYKKRSKRFGSIWGGFAIAAITYFLLIKGAKGASFMTDDLKQAVKDNAFMIILISFVAWTVILQIATMVFKRFDMMKFIVFIGTFALAMGFAGNDLVNFIGVPLAGLNSYMLFDASGEAGNQILMTGLAGKVPTPTILLVLAGLIMTVTLWTSKKARSVLNTSLDLGRQYDGPERFTSYKVSRSLVRFSMKLANGIRMFLPSRVNRFVDDRFDQQPFVASTLGKGGDAPAFDLVRAASTLVVASILISIGTSFKLPLSTTYVTFMVFMGTSLADGAWGRESAVYRISGMLSVIGGWFFTAFSAFAGAFIVANIFYFGGPIAVVVILILTALYIYRTNKLHKKREEEKSKFEETIKEGFLSRSKVMEISAETLDKYLTSYSSILERAITGLENEDYSQLTKLKKEFKPIHLETAYMKNVANSSQDKLEEDELDTGHFYILATKYVHEMAKNVRNILEPALTYVDNNHKPFLSEQIEEFREIHSNISEKLQSSINLYKNDDEQGVKELLGDMEGFVKQIRKTREKQIKRIRKHKVGTRNSLLYLSILDELRNLGWHTSRLVKVYKDFISSKGGKGKKSKQVGEDYESEQD